MYSVSVCAPKGSTLINILLIRDKPHVSSSIAVLIYKQYEKLQT